MACHDCGKRFSRFAFDNRSRRRFPLAAWRWSSGRQSLGNAMASLIGPQVKALCAAAGGLVKLSELFAFGKDTLAIYSFM
jgi:hypothetical protein